MSERVYPSNRPGGGVQNLNGAYTKGQGYAASLPRYRPEPPKKRSSSCGLCCLWFAVAVVVLILLVGIAALTLWILYRPHEPKFSVDALQISKFNVAKNNRLTFQASLQLKAKNPNKKLAFFYDDFSFKITSGDVDLADGSVPGFFHNKKNTTLVKVDLKTPNLALDASDSKRLKSAQSKGKISVEVGVKTNVRVKMGSWKTHKIRVQVKCTDISTVISNSNKPSATSTTTKSKCNFKIKFKIFKWYL